jgi:hypothetical protein
MVRKVSTNDTSTQGEQHTPPLRILEVKRDDDKVRLRVKLSPEFYSELYRFLEQKGLACWGHEKEGIALLLEFGSCGESCEEMDKDIEAMRRDGPRYAAMSFQTAEYYARNGAIVMGLRFHLQENRALKKKLRENGLGDLVSEDEWDGWDNSIIEDLYRRYVFGK